MIEVQLSTLFKCVGAYKIYNLFQSWIEKLLICLYQPHHNFDVLVHHVIDIHNNIVYSESFLFTVTGNLLYAKIILYKWQSE